MTKNKSNTKANLKDKQKIKELEKQLRMMKKENELTQLKADAYKTMIEVAEEEFNIKTVPVGSEKSLERGSPSQTVKKLKIRYPLKGLQVLCGLSLRRSDGLSRFAYYKALKQKHLKQDIEEEIIAKVKDIREKLPLVGTLKLHYMMVSFRNEKGIKCGRDKLHNILKKEDMLVRPKTSRVKTTYSEHGYRKFENLTQDFEPSGINELWVSDITARAAPLHKNWQSF